MDINLTVGDKAPVFSAQDHKGQLLSLAAYAGKKVVLYFYPKDNTPGCAIEAKGFQSLLPEFATNNTIVLGVSKDSLKSHQKFCDNYALGFSLVLDADAELCGLYGVLAEKSMFGKKYFGIKRTTFLINERGLISNIWHKVNVLTHATDVLQAVKSI